MTTPHPDPDSAAAAASASLKATVSGASMLSIGGLTGNDLAIVGGLLLGVAGFALQWYYQRRRDLREEAEHEVRMHALLDNQEHIHDDQ